MSQPSPPRAELPLPDELVRVILKISTRMPAAFETAVIEQFDPPQALKVANKIAASISFKLALGRVCKTFQELMEEFLYESIVIFRVEQLFPAIRSFQTMLSSTTYKIFRGERCLRLDIALGHRSQRFGVASWKDQWPWVTHALATLLTACPKLQILVLHSPPNTSYHSPLPTYSTLWMQIASNLTNLQVFANSLADMTEQDLIQIIGSLRSLEMVHVQAVRTGAPTFAPLPPIRTARLFRADDIAQCILTYETASWPTNSSDSASAPKLHSIHPGSQGTKLLELIESPRLTTLSIPERGSDAFFAAQFESKATITRLVFNAESSTDNMWMILRNFPKVSEFKIVGVVAHDSMEHHFGHLEILEVSRLSSEDASYLLEIIATGKLPKLRELVLSDIHQSTIDEALQNQVDEFAARGISLHAKTENPKPVGIF